MGKLEQHAIRPVAIMISLVIHLIALTAISFPQVAAPAREPDYLEITRLDVPIKPDLPEAKPDQPQPAVMVETPEDEKEAEKKPPVVVMLPNDILVDLGQPQPGDEAPDQARFASQRNMKVERETVKRTEARTGSPGDAPGRRKGEIDNPDTKEEIRSPKRPRSKAAKTEQPAKPKPGGKGVIRIPKPPAEDLTEIEIAKRGAMGVDGEDLAITMGDARKSYDSDNGSIERLPPDVMKGSVTALNAREYAYASFYNRINKVIRFYWEPFPALEAMNWSGRTLITQLNIVTDADGAILSVEVGKSCGYPRVDAEAIKAVRQAAPFYNIPPALIDEQGHFVYQLGFIIESN